MSKRRETAVEVMDAYKAWDIERVMAYRTEDCTQLVVPSTFLPLSLVFCYLDTLLPPPGPRLMEDSVESLDRPAMDNATFRKYFGGMMPLFKNFTPTVHQLVEDEKANTIAIWCSSTADTIIGPYGNEYMLLLFFNEAGDKVEKVIEFVDTEYSKSFFGRLRAHLEQKEVEASLPKYERGL